MASDRILVPQEPRGGPPPKLIDGTAMTADQLAIYERIRHIFFNDPAFSSPPAVAFMTDVAVRRLCVAWKWKPEQIEKEARATIAWRAAARPWAVRIDPAVALMMAGTQYWNGHDRAGRPIMYCRMRNHNAKMDRTQRVLYFLQAFEKGIALMDATRGVEQWVIIMDEAGKASKNNDVTFLKQLATPMFHHYSERLYRAYVLNPSGMFSLLFRMVQTFIDDRTKSKVRVIDKPDKKGPTPWPQLAAEVGLENIEPEYGGTLAPPASPQAYLDWLARVGPVPPDDGAASASGPVLGLADAGPPVEGEDEE